MIVKETGDTFNCDCGFSWLRGKSGAHDCGDGYRKQIADLHKQQRKPIAHLYEASLRRGFVEGHAAEDSDDDVGAPGTIPVYNLPPSPVVKLTPPINPVMFNSDVIFGYNKARAEDKAAIEAAGVIVKDCE